MAPDLVTLEMGGAIEVWSFRADGSIAIVLTIAATCWSCKTRHFWFINRDGRTKCIDCDSGRPAPGQPKFEEVRV
ncbi:MAG: hypothetical protein ACREB3_07235 [Burkholderiales bacterium]